MDAPERLGKIFGHRRAEKSAADGTGFRSLTPHERAAYFSGKFK
jgi:hypothetical protein